MTGHVPVRQSPGLSRLALAGTLTALVGVVILGMAVYSTWRHTSYRGEGWWRGPEWEGISTAAWALGTFLLVVGLVAALAAVFRLWVAGLGCAALAAAAVGFGVLSYTPSTYRGAQGELWDYAAMFAIGAAMLLLLSAIALVIAGAAIGWQARRARSHPAARPAP